MTHRPRRTVHLPPVPDAEGPAFQALVDAATVRGAQAVLSALRDEVAAWREEADAMDVPPTATDARIRLDTWFRERNRRIAVLGRALELLEGTTRAPQAPNAVGESPCELARDHRLS